MSLDMEVGALGSGRTSVEYRIFWISRSVTSSLPSASSTSICCWARISISRSYQTGRTLVQGSLSPPMKAYLGKVKVSLLLKSLQMRRHLPNLRLRTRKLLRRHTARGRSRSRTYVIPNPPLANKQHHQEMQNVPSGVFRPTGARLVLADRPGPERIGAIVAGTSAGAPRRRATASYGCPPYVESQYRFSHWRNSRLSLWIEISSVQK